MKWTRYVLVALVASACAPEEGGPIRDGFLDGDMPADGTDGGCTGTDPYCSTDRTQVLTCDPFTGAVTVTATCIDPEICIDGACVDAECIPHRSECIDEYNQRVCRSDGSGWETIPCPEGQQCNFDSGQCEEVCFLRIFILLDQSGSMSDGTPSKWSQAQTALHSVMTSSTAAEVEFGFGAFPSDSNCSTDGLVLYPVPTATASIVDSHFSSGPNGNTPLYDAVHFFETDTTANLRDPAYHNALLVVSDGMDSCYIDCLARCLGSPTPFVCLLECEAEIEAILATDLATTTAYLRDTLEIRTYVIGFGEGVSDVELSAIAENGGTVLGDWIAADDVDDLTAAFETVLEEMWECNDIII